MAVSTNHDLGGCVIQLRLSLIDIGMKNYRGFQGYSPFQFELLAQTWVEWMYVTVRFFWMKWHIVLKCPSCCYPNMLIF